jgi:hypothetical protein
MAKRIKIVLLLVVILLVFAWSYFYLEILPPADSLPSIDMVQGIKAVVLRPGYSAFKTTPDSFETLAVSPEHLHELYSTLLPSTPLSLQQRTWIPLGDLIITSTNGKKVRIGLISVCEGGDEFTELGFKIGDGYYRGGRTWQLEALLSKVRNAANRNSKK